MKKILSAISVVFISISLLGCTKIYHSTHHLMEKAREEILIANSDSIEMQFAGMCGKGNKAIAWFISGNEYQAHYYLPMEIEIIHNGANYRFIHTYKPMLDRCPDVAIVNFHNGYAFLINNPEVEVLKITMQNGKIIEEYIPKDELPYTLYVYPIPSEYIFLDSEKNEIF